MAGESPRHNCLLLSKSVWKQRYTTVRWPEIIVVIACNDATPALRRLVCASEVAHWSRRRWVHVVRPPALLDINAVVDPKAVFQVIEEGRLDDAVVLEPADDDAWVDT